MPNEQEIIDPLSLNLYTYCWNNPVLFYDPDGNEPKTPKYMSEQAKDEQQRAMDKGGAEVIKGVATTVTPGGNVVKAGQIAVKTVKVVSTVVKTERAVTTAVKTATTTANATSKITPAIQNSMNHIFGKTTHNFSGLLKSYGGDQFKAYNAIVNSAQKMVDAKKLTGTFDSVKNPLIVKVGNYTAHVGGKVVDGVFKIGTAYIK